MLKQLFRLPRWIWVSAVVVMLICLLVAVASGAVVGHRFVIGVTGGQVSESGLVLQSAVGQPVVGGGDNALSLCSGFHASACSSGMKVFLPVLMRSG